MAEYTIPKPYRDFYVTNPYIELKESNERLEQETLVRSDIQYGTSLHGKNTLENKEIAVKVESKNLIPFPYVHTSDVKNGVNITVGDDGGVSFEGTASAYTVHRLYLGEISDFLKDDSSKKITAHMTGTFSGVSLAVVLYANTTYIRSFSITSKFMFDINAYPTATRIEFALVVQEGVTASGTIYPQVEKGDTATSYSLYQAEGTPVTVTTCGKNLLNIPSDYTFLKQSDRIPLCLKKGMTYTLSCSYATNDGTDNPYIFLIGSDGVGFQKIPITTTPTTFTMINDSYYYRVWANGYTHASAEGITANLKNLMLESGHKATTYQSFNKTDINTTIGNEVVIKQLNDYTNIYAYDPVYSTTPAIASLSTCFVLYNEELFHDKLTAIIGTFANRPTDIADYDRLYIATDKTDTDRSTILPAGKSGATASNWIYI